MSSTEEHFGTCPACHRPVLPRQTQVERDGDNWHFGCERDQRIKERRERLESTPVTKFEPPDDWQPTRPLTYRTIVADPPWRYGSQSGAASRHVAYVPTLGNQVEYWCGLHLNDNGGRARRDWHRCSVKENT